MRGLLTAVIVFAALPGYAFSIYESDAKEIYHNLKKMELAVREVHRSFEKASTSASRMNQKINLAERFDLHSR